MHTTTTTLTELAAGDVTTPTGSGSPADEEGLTCDQNSCDRCGQDVEAMSDAPTVWHDRGGNTTCHDETHDGMPHAARFRA